MERSKRLDRVSALKERGTLRDPEAIDWLGRCLDDPDERVREAACRAIVKEVVGSDQKGLRLRALERLKPLLQPWRRRPSEGQLDLHTHDYFSEDAYPTPTALILEAYEEGLAVLGVVSHNQRYEDDEAERAAALLGLGLFKGTELSVRVSLGGGRNESIHLLQLIMGKPDPERMHQLFQGFVLQYQRELLSLGCDLQQALQEPWPALSLLRERTYDRQTTAIWRRFQERYGSRLPLTWEELEAARRGDRVYAFTIAVALWKKFGPQLQEGWERTEGDPSTRVAFQDVGKVYEKWIRPERNHNEEARSAIHLPDPTEVACRAALLQRKLILPHPNECSLEALERTLAELARVEVGGRQYPGLLVGVEYYSHKLKEPLKRRVKGLVEQLNRDHPDYRRHPLLLLPGSDYHGRFSPRCPLGLRENYPADIQGYRQEVLEALYRKVD